MLGFYPVFPYFQKPNLILPIVQNGKLQANNLPDIFEAPRLDFSLQKTDYRINRFDILVL
jgi:hypothetical protein